MVGSLACSCAPCSSAASLVGCGPPTTSYSPLSCFLVASNNHVICPSLGAVATVPRIANRVPAEFREAVPTVSSLTVPEGSIWGSDDAALCSSMRSVPHPGVDALLQRAEGASRLRRRRREATARGCLRGRPRRDKPRSGVSRLARPALLDGSVDDGWAAGLVGGSGPSYACGMVLLVAVELAMVTVCVAAGLAMGRRSHFWARVLLGCLSVPALVLFVALVAPQVAVALGWLILMAAFIVVPVLSCQSPDSLPGYSDGDDGGGSGPDRPPASPEPPDGGVPLPDADPSRTRLRDHGSPKIRYVTRWRSREPERGPAPAPPNQ
jgi:hypothetical protein